MMFIWGAWTQLGGLGGWELGGGEDGSGGGWQGGELGGWEVGRWGGSVGRSLQGE